MSTEKKPCDLPKCACFNTNDAITWNRCCSVAKAGHELCGGFMVLAEDEVVCKDALPYMLDLAIISITAYIAKTQGPALEYGSVEIQAESERLMTGLEARVIARMKDVYERARELGLSEEKVRAMYESNGELQ